jgi:ornithine carbamoyltransferase
MKSLISIRDLGTRDIQSIFLLARQIKKNPKKFRHALDGEVVGMIFEKPSTRTRIASEVGTYELGGNVFYQGPEDTQLGIREEVRDVARVMTRYMSAIVLRTFKHDTIVEFDQYFKGPVINGLSDLEHPCQAMADYFTLEEQFGKRQKVPLLAFVGDGNNVLNSLMLLCAKLGGRLRYATPKGHEPSAALLEQAQALARSTGAEIQSAEQPLEAVRGADAVYTVVWVSMGQEGLKKKKMQAFAGMQLNAELMKAAKPGARVMHCLPAHRGEEITDEMMESRQSVVFDQAENRLHIHKALLLHLLS